MTHISYELAKELKDAGFPITKVTWSWKTREDGTEKEHRPNPSLSELIEVCVIGGRAIMLRNDANTVAWYVSSGLFAGNGTTPEEALARLWLALNKK